jgi:hypothetical protein
MPVHSGNGAGTLVPARSTSRLPRKAGSGWSFRIVAIRTERLLNLIEGFFAKAARSVLRHTRVNSKHESGGQRQLGVVDDRPGGDHGSDGRSSRVPSSMAWFEVPTPWSWCSRGRQRPAPNAQQTGN